PAFADAVLLHVGLFLAVETHADAAFERGGVVEAAARVAGQAVGRGVAHCRLSVRRPRRGPTRINAAARAVPWRSRTPAGPTAQTGSDRRPGKRLGHPCHRFHDAWHATDGRARRKLAMLLPPWSCSHERAPSPPGTAAFRATRGTAA